MKMKVWHGSYTAIEEVDLAFSETQRDFGRGFYVTNLREQAEIWARRTGRIKGSNGVVTEFEYSEFMTREMKMKVLRFDDYNDEWLDFVVLNRLNENEQPAHDYDIVEGPVADDRIATRVGDFIAGAISREQFLSDLVRNPSHQICFCTVWSLQALSPSFPKQRARSAIFHAGEEVVESLMSDYGLSDIAAADLYYTSAAFARLADESTGLYRRPWQEIYEMLKQELKI